MLSKEDQERLRGLLDRRHEEVSSALASSKEEARPVGLDLSIGRLTRMDAMQQQHMATARRQRLETQLAQIRQAQSKLQEGTYGVCVRCGEPIELARLEARPEAPFCLDCQR